MSGRYLFAVCAIATFATTVTPAAFAAHPLTSEDTGTQGSGNAELELGNGWSRTDGSRSYLFQPQLSYGYAPTVDLIVQPSWLASYDPAGGHANGLGDTNLDAKWRFYGAAPWSLGVRAGLEVPTGMHGLGLPDGKVSPHAVLVATFDSTPFTLNMNLGYTYLPGTAGQRTGLYHVSSAGMLAVNENLYLALEASADSNPDPTQSRPLADALAGVIYTVHPGLDIDAGYLAGLNSSSVDRQWLVGVTYRWAP